MDAYENGYPALSLVPVETIPNSPPPFPMFAQQLKWMEKFFDFAVATNGINARKKHRFWNNRVKSEVEKR